MTRAPLTRLALAVTLGLAAGTPALAASEWLTTYDGTAGDEDWPSAMTTYDGITYVAGTTIGADGSADGLILAYDVDGVVQWTVVHTGVPSGEDGFGDVAVRADGAIFATGWTETGDGDLDMLTVKLDDQGAVQWTATYDGPPSRSEEAVSIAILPSGDVAVTGPSEESTGLATIALVRYDDNGTQIYHRRAHDGPTFRHDPMKVVATPSGDMLVLHWSSDTSATGEPLTFQGALFTDAGSIGWEYVYDGPGEVSRPVDATVDANGILTLTGVDENASGDLDVFVVQLSSTGTELWTTAFDGGEGDDAPESVHALDDGTVVVTGWTTTADGTTDALTLRLDDDGSTLWTRTFDDDGHDDRGIAVVLDGADRIVVVGDGETGVVDGARQSLVLRYLLDGTEDLVETYVAADSLSASSYLAAVDDAGDVVVAGITEESPGNLDVYLAGYAGTVLATDEPMSTLPAVTALDQNRPNPFNPTTTIAYALPRAERVTLTVYDLSGREVARLIDGVRPAGHHEVRWHASNLATGTYFYRLRAGSEVIERKLTLLK